MTASKISRSSRTVIVWLAIGVFCVFMQVVIGGITRLTDSGLSITEWNPIMGAIPPMNVADWQEAFDKYKVHAKTQFEAIHADMTLSEFKMIFFWEWFHRQWARIMGLIFLIPFIFFVIKGQLHRKLIQRLGIVIAIAMLAALFGWIMVASGLNTENYAWVNAYKLSIHLGIGFSLFAYLLWTFFHEWKPDVPVFHNLVLKRWITVILVVLAMQIIFGGWMSGMKAGLAYPTFPDMNGKVVASELLDASQWTTKNLREYNKNGFAPALIQILHRTAAYVLTVLILYVLIISRKLKLSSSVRTGIYGMSGMLVIQFLLGVFTLINCKGNIPLTLGVLHQAGALILLGFVLYTAYQVRKRII